jgi:Mg-chelatase subunit ChlD
MNRYALVLILLLAVTSVHAEVLTSFEEGASPSYTFLDDEPQIATLLFPRNACISSFALTATPGELVDVGALPVDAVLITDVSGSMGWAMDGRQSGFSPDRSRLEVAKEAIGVLIDNFITPERDNRLALVSYSTSSQRDRLFTDDIAALKGTVENYDDNGATCISCGVATALKTLESARPEAVKVIFLMTDGEANRIISSYSETNYRYGSTSASTSVSEQQTFEQVCDPDTGAVSYGYITQSIAISTGAGLSFMESLADCPGNDGEYFEAFTEEDVIRIYEELARFKTSSWPTPQMTIVDDQVLSTTAVAQDPIPIDGSCSGCEDPFLAIQRELYECFADQISCEIPVTTWSTTNGIVTLDDLSIEYETTGITAITQDDFVCTLLPECGNGELNPGETCEPPNTATCDENCQVIGTPPPGAICGENGQEPGEECDDGPDNRPPGYNCGAAPGQWCSYCTTDCLFVRQFNPGDTETFVCGNGLPEPAEECDAGPDNGVQCTPTETEGCEWCTDSTHPSGECRIAYIPPIGVPPPNCGDLFVDPLENEECDPPTAACVPDYGDTCDYCSNLCRDVSVDGGSCGDGDWQPSHEQCDPAFPAHVGKCDSSCKWENTEPPEVKPPYAGFVEINLSTRRYFPPVEMNDYIDFDSVFGPNPSVIWEEIDDYGLDGIAVPDILLIEDRFGLTDVFEDEDVYYPVFKVTDPAGKFVELKFKLNVTLSTGQPPVEPDTRLMITKGTQVSGYFEADLTSQVVTWGPYTLDVRVWQR